MNRFSPQSKAGSGGHSQALFSTARLPDVINWPALKVFSILNLGTFKISHPLGSCLFKNSVLLTIE
ncbi:hypothetical protein T01_8268 [Trichinella spiralis]|uniref:Uncharacterized protein n=1 Tax=Trichinella spiralis TaxID=6334 RepID=A0A0V1AR47_TRISP|nr:hypothetical protein T01_8268 [Trichinella spiralis]